MSSPAGPRRWGHGDGVRAPSSMIDPAALAAGGPEASAAAAIRVGAPRPGESFEFGEHLLPRRRG